MKFRNIVLAVATVAALSPAISHATPEKVSLKACASAFATSIAAPGAATPGYKLAYHGEMSAPIMDYAREYAFMLEARNKSGAAIARARCLTDQNGVVTSLSTVPLSAKSDATASPF